MVHVQAFLRQVSTLFANLFEHPDWRNILDIAILAVLIYNIIKLVMHTRANSLFKGIVLILVVGIDCYQQAMAKKSKMKIKSAADAAKS